MSTFTLPHSFIALKCITLATNADLALELRKLVAVHCVNVCLKKRGENVGKQLSFIRVLESRI